MKTLVGKFGHSLNLKDTKTINKSLNKLLSDVEGKKEQNLVDTLAIKCRRALEAAGTGTDIMAHRLLQSYLDKEKSANQEAYEAMCKHSSEMENLATNAERDSIKYMQIKYMVDRMDEEFLGVISGVTEWGIYVEIISNKCEGMIRLRDMKEDHFDFDQENFAVIGRRTKKVYQLGDEVYVSVRDGDLERRHLDFNLLGKRNEFES